MLDLWEDRRGYRIFRSYVDWCTRRSYRKLTVEGRRMQPDGGGVILAPNHSNTLMDALVVLQSSRDITFFGCRADVFRKPRIAKILRAMRIVPIARERDGLREVAKNIDVMSEVIDTMGHGVPFCVFPEGRHRPMHSLLPVRKGVTRLALQSYETGLPTFIQPVGIDYSDFFHYRGTCRIRFGEPIDVGSFVSGHEGLGKSEMIWALSRELESRMKGLILYIPDDENYEARLAEARPRKPLRWWQIALAVLTAPLFLLCAVLSLPQWLTAEIVCHKLKDPAFKNSVRFLARLFIGPLMFIILAAVGFIVLPPLAAVGLLVCWIFSYSFFYDWLNLLRINY